jgi:hypothetical protein
LETTLTEQAATLSFQQFEIISKEQQELEARHQDLLERWLQLIDKISG